MDRRGWDAPDFALISGDAYVDHPSFGHAVISRVLEAEGFRVAVVAQPDWTDAASFLRCGVPKLGVLVTSGVVDSMVNHYTAAKKRRGEDTYSPGGAAGRRPDRAVITYCNRLRSAMRGVPLIIGGVEAGLRALAHYDYWDDYIRRSILIDSGADLLVYGMGESAIREIAARLRGGENVRSIKNVRGTAYADTEKGLAESVERARDALKPDGNRLRYIEAPSYRDVCAAKKAYAEAFLIECGEQDPVRGNAVFQRYSTTVVVKNPPSAPLTPAEMDRIYELPYARAWHPAYDKDGGVPALEEVRFSVTSHRGCFGACSFCSINLHQGRCVQKRGADSIIREVEALARSEGFKGYIHDIGGPSANLRNASCIRQRRAGMCRDRRCLFPKPCKNLIVDHGEYVDILKRARSVSGVKKVFIRSGVRYDYIMYDKNREFLNELCEHHISGQLKVAPEHVSANALRLMGKPPAALYGEFCAEYLKINQRLNKRQYLVPYLISGHPGCLLSDAVELAQYLCENRINPEQVQDFYPTPGTLSTCMYYTGINPLTMSRAHIPTADEKAMQRALLQCRKPENRELVVKALRLTGRTDLIGFGKGCLLRPEKPAYGRGRREEPAHGRGSRGMPGKTANAAAAANTATAANVRVKPGSRTKPASRAKPVRTAAKRTKEGLKPEANNRHHHRRSSRHRQRDSD